MADPKTERVGLKLPSGERVVVTVPAGMQEQQIVTMLRSRHPELFAPPMPSVPKVEMKESVLPKLFRSGTETLPVVGGVGGALAGAPAAGWGAVAGGGLGAAAGETARQALNRTVFGKEEVSPVSKEGLKRTAMTGAVSGAFEVPGAIATTIGNQVLKRIAMAKSTKEVGDVVEAMMKTKPAGVSAKAIERDLLMGHKQASKGFGDALSKSKGTVDLDTILAGPRAEAKVADASVKGTLKRFDRMINAVKYNAGIRGNKATADQLFAFQQQLQKPGYSGIPGPTGETLKKLAQQTYQSAGAQVRVLAPETDIYLREMTNLHAARQAVKSYAPGGAASLALTAKLHPRATALVSPVVTGGAVLGADKARKAIRDVSAEVTR